ncbi:hypothetical protein PoB_002754100 [Plakobranchus ocellatus]|uniref:Uncharacterized protein n=1 Tax=Plakobranchus ocellatus TaxID=259542 RepID=A0AAV4A2V3_9GAST|nr:hypothetical protein PoB_002754100 [Plakobranchus ocellatus]
MEPESLRSLCCGLAIHTKSEKLQSKFFCLSPAPEACASAPIIDTTPLPHPPSPHLSFPLTSSYIEGVGGTVDCESALISAGTLLSWVRVPPSEPGMTESLKAWLNTRPIIIKPRISPSLLEYEFDADETTMIGTRMLNRMLSPAQIQPIAYQLSPISGHYSTAVGLMLCPNATVFSKVDAKKWPEQRKDVPKELQTLFDYRCELSVVDGIIFKWMRKVLPPILAAKKKRGKVASMPPLGIHSDNVGYWPEPMKGQCKCLDTRDTRDCGQYHLLNSRSLSCVQFGKTIVGGNQSAN